MSFSLDFPRAYGPLSAKGTFRELPEDFIVDEILGYQPSGEGEHVYLKIKKTGENTAWVAGIIAKLANVKENDVSYCGRKDRHAVTTQWFSVYLPQQALIDWSAINSNTIEVLAVSRHSHKLRRGEHQANQFVIRLRDLHCEDKAQLEEKLRQVLKSGVPNYFGEQRFGRNANNLHAVEPFLVDRKPIKDRQKKSMVLSAARAYIFNQVLAKRVELYNWWKLLAGDPSTEVSGPLWGRGRLTSQEDTKTIEESVIEAWLPWCNGLEHQGLTQERRSLVLLPENGHFYWDDDVHLVISFSLASGEFATAVLRELAELEEVDHFAATVTEQSSH